jgi:pseudouridine synthase
MQNRIQKIMSNAGFCSRRQAELLIQEKKVTVNGKIAVLGDKASAEDIIKVEGVAINKQKPIYIMFHKPVGYITSLSDPYHKTIMELIPVKERIFPVGRLDYNTSGLLLLTNDGDFANRIMHPKHEIKKTYIVRIDQPITEKAIFCIKKGVKLEDTTTFPAEISEIEDTLLELTIHEGKKRIIRRMFKALGYSVIELQRIKIGNLSISNLPLAKFKYLKEEEIKKIFS